MLWYCKNVRESSQTFFATDIVLKRYVRKLRTKTMQTGWQWLRIRSAISVTFTPDSYVAKPYKRNEKIRNCYVWKLRQNYVTEITLACKWEIGMGNGVKKLRSYNVPNLSQNFVTKISFELHLEVTLELRFEILY